MLNLPDEFCFLNNINNWSNHRVLNLLALSITSGDVLELGMGDSSTPYFAKYCTKHGRKLFSYDSNKDWVSKYKHLESDLVKINHMENWDNLPVEYHSVIFIDHAPGERRVVDIERFKDHCDFMVIHDSEPAATGYMLYKIWPMFKYRMNYVTPGAWTTIVSNTINLG
jgi:hypothetical protein